MEGATLGECAATRQQDFSLPKSPRKQGGEAKTEKNRAEISRMKITRGSRAVPKSTDQLDFQRATLIIH